MKHSLRFPFLLALFGAVFLSASALRADERPATVSAPVVEQQQTLPAEQQPPAVLNTDADLTDEEKRKKKPSIFDKASALLKDRGDLANSIAALQGDLVTARNTLAERDLAIANLTRERDDLMSGRAQLENAITALEQKQTSVVDTVAGLGFEANKLPTVGDLDGAAENSVEGLQAKLAQEKDSDKRGALAAQIIALRNAKKK